ncbi:MAG TPA: hypothetical protein VL549_07160 [Gemmatimonadales bacterium]|nr:hypothetical protein [Gemmatimonadales bacterium]
MIGSLVLCALVGLAACVDATSTSVNVAARVMPARAYTHDAMLVGAGDIAQCYQPDNPTQITAPELTGAESTAVLLDSLPGT